MIIYWPAAPTASVDDSFRQVFSDEFLRRHRARVLDPVDAVRLPSDQNRLSPTVYRTSTLLVADKVYKSSAARTVLEKALASLGLEGQFTAAEGYPDAAPRTLVLKVLDGSRPRRLDAWEALQAIRGYGRQPLVRLRKLDPGLLEMVRSGVWLDHVLVASAVQMLGGVPGAGQGFAPVVEPTNTVWSGYEWRRPVAVASRPPEPVEPKSGRRAVVAVLDTGLRANDVLRVPPLARDEDWQDENAFATIDQGVQNMIGAVGRGLVAAGEDVEVLDTPKDTPDSSAPLVGELDTHTGHGTFIAGIIQQIAPNAKVLAIRVMSGDGGVAENVLVPALHKLAERVEQALAGDETKMVDVVSLSLGYHPEDMDPIAPPPLLCAIDRLRKLGVVVVAAAGNSATSLRFAPASYADRKSENEVPPVISVGALNPNGSKALFSNEGKWVTCWATGAGVVSTFPQDVNASHNASTLVPGCDGAPPRETFDSDDYVAGHAVWLGTSFAAPHVAAQIAQVLMDSGDLPSIQENACARAAKAVGDVREKALKEWSR